MDDVARAARVSKQTVSAVINNKSGISEKTRIRVREIVARLDYQPNLLAGSLRAQRSFTVGVVIPSITNPFYPELVRGIEDEAQRQGYSVFLCNADENSEKEIQYLDLLRRHRIAGLIAATIRVNRAWTEALKSLASQGVPVVFVPSTHKLGNQVVCIMADDEEGFIKATDHLLDLGHERIGMISPPVDTKKQSPRVTGFLKAHARRGKKVAPELIVPGGWHVAEGQQGAARLLQLSRPPTAVVAPNDMAAIGAIIKIKELGWRVPADIAVVGYDNIAIAEWYDPALTTVDQPHYRMGQRAMQAVLDRLNHPQEPAEMIKFQTTLVVRHSSGAKRL
ncbi:MAG: LacI family DNA-binding transcriptional regulator [Verrucomicrobia bacterium]|nr:LacI family DNA-binding transcriptional regulator [Verrucomicrobiota bacterium]